MEFSPRLTQILFLLSNANQPIPAGKLAEHLEISRRTIFRELEHVDRSLRKYDLQLTAKQPQGLWLEGTTDARREFKKRLESLSCFDPKNKEERQKSLVIELLAHDEPEKYFYYANLLEVSEGTVSNDLIAIEEELAKKKIFLNRKPGYGVHLTYDEADYRKALLHYLLKYEPGGFFNAVSGDGAYARRIDKSLIRDVVAIVEGTQNQLFIQMTEESYIACIMNLVLAVLRMKKQRALPGNKIQNEPSDHRYILLADHLADALEEKFSTRLPEAERLQIAVYLSGAKLKNANAYQSPALNETLLPLVYEMIQAYDVLSAFDFKHDDEFVAGIIAHLTPTIVRLKHHIEITNPFLSQTKAMYPDIYRKTEKAAAILAKHLDCEIPEDELGFLALHFGAAAVRHKRKQLNRKVSVGVVCTSGIGISRLLLSRLNHTFQNQISVTVFAQSDLNEQALEGIDFLVSSYRMDGITKPFVSVNPILSEPDIENIAALIARSAEQKQQNAKRAAQSGDANDSMLITNEMHSILNDFQICTLSPDTEFGAAVRFAAEKLGLAPAKTSQIILDLTEREKQSTQVIPEFEIALLHAKTTAVNESKLLLLLPSGPCFSEPHFMGIKAVVVMLIPRFDSRRTLAISSISSALFEDDAFLNAVKRGDETQIRRDLQYYLEQYLLQYLKGIYEN